MEEEIRNLFIAQQRLDNLPAISCKKYSITVVHDNTGLILDVDKMRYNGIIVENFDKKSVIGVLQKWVNGFNSETGELVTDFELVNSLDSIRRYGYVDIPGFYLTIINGRLKELTESQIKKILSHPHSVYNEEYSDLARFLQTKMFQVRPNHLIRLLHEEGGEVYKIKIVNPSTGKPVNLQQYTRVVKDILFDNTGIKEIDELYTFGSSASGLSSATFWKIDQKGFDIYPFVTELEDDNPKFKKIQGMKHTKAALMPQYPCSKDVTLFGQVRFDFPEFDGVVAFISQTGSKRMLRHSAFEADDVWLIQVASPDAKGTIVVLEDDEFIKRFNVNPFSKEHDIEVVFLAEALRPPTKNGDKEFHSAWRCDDMGCDAWGHPHFTPKEFCPSCGKPAREFKFFSIPGCFLGFHQIDLNFGSGGTKIGNQVMARGNINRKVLIKNLIDRMDELEEIVHGLYLPENKAIVKEYKHLGDKIISESMTIRDKISRMMLSSGMTTNTAIRGTRSMLVAGVWTGHPRLYTKVMEFIARNILDSRNQVKLNPYKVGEDKVFFGATHVRPGFELQEDELRIPEKFENSTVRDLITVIRYPVRPGGTDMATLKKAGFSKGNTVQVHPTTWNYMEGDFDGDLSIAVPIWVTGICKQIKANPTPKASTPRPKNTEEIYLQYKQAIFSKSRIGIVDTFNTECVTEAECLGEPLSQLENEHLREIQQLVMDSFKHSRQMCLTKPSARLKKMLHTMEMGSWEQNPVNVFLYFNPSDDVILSEDEEGNTSYKIPRSLRKFSFETGVPTPQQMFSNLEWAKFLQSYGAYLLGPYLRLYPDKAYKVLNHPYLEVMKRFVAINLSKTDKLVEASEMYAPSFDSLFKKSAEYLKDTGIETSTLGTILSETLDYMLEYEDMVKKFMTGKIKWPEVSKFSLDKSKQLLALCQQLASRNPEKNLRDSLEELVFGYMGSARNEKGWMISNSAVFWMASPKILEKATRIYNETNQGGLDSYTTDLVVRYLTS